MEFKFNSNNVPGNVLKIDNTLTAEGHEKNVDLKNKMGFIIDEIGRISARAQQLTSPITSANKLINSNDILYMLIENDSPEHLTVIGILKMGWKNLYIYNKEGTLHKEDMVCCLLDFYIHESKQRYGYGKRLIEYMLEDLHLGVNSLAIDKPTIKLSQFMSKHFQLSKLVNQGNNFVVYEEFFDDAFNEKKQDNSKYRATYRAKNCEPTYGRHDAHKHHDTMGEIVQGQGHYNDSFVKHQEANNTDHKQTNEANSHSQSTAASFETDKDGNCVKRDLKFHHSSNW